MAKREALKCKVGDLLLIESRVNYRKDESLREVAKTTPTTATDESGTVWSLTTHRERGGERSDGYHGCSIIRVATRADIQRVKEADRLDRLRRTVLERCENLRRNINRIPADNLAELAIALETALKAAGEVTNG